MWTYGNTAYLQHAARVRGPYEDHAYVDRFIKNGKWVYVYPEDLEAQRRAKQRSAEDPYMGVRKTVNRGAAIASRAAGNAATAVGNTVTSFGNGMRGRGTSPNLSMYRAGAQARATGSKVARSARDAYNQASRTIGNAVSNAAATARRVGNETWDRARVSADGAGVAIRSTAQRGASHVNSFVGGFTNDASRVSDTRAAAAGARVRSTAAHWAGEVQSNIKTFQKAASESIARGKKTVQNWLGNATDTIRDKASDASMKIKGDISYAKNQVTKAAKTVKNNVEKATKSAKKTIEKNAKALVKSVGAKLEKAKNFVSSLVKSVKKKK